MDSKPLRLPVRGSKNPFEAHKEAELAKRRRLARCPQARSRPGLTALQDQEATALYESFVADFSGEAPLPGSKTFVRGGVVEPGSRPCDEPARALLERALLLWLTSGS